MNSKELMIGGNTSVGKDGKEGGKDEESEHYIETMTCLLTNIRLIN